MPNEEEVRPVVQPGRRTRAARPSAVELLEFGRRSEMLNLDVTLDRVLEDVSRLDPPGD